MIDTREVCGIHDGIDPGQLLNRHQRPGNTINNIERIQFIFCASYDNMCGELLNTAMINAHFTDIY